MSEKRELLTRIADALERLAPPSPDTTDWLNAPAYIWAGDAARAVGMIEAPALAHLKGIDRQKQSVCDNIARLAAGHPAHDMLLWGSRGMGKSALIRAAVRDAQANAPQSLALVQVSASAFDQIPALFGELASIGRQFLIYLDDLGFGDGDTVGPRQMRSWLEGGVEARPANIRLAVTSNRRAIVPRHSAEQDDPLNPRDAVDDMLALADRFGLSIGFHNCTQDEYLAIIAGYAKHYGLEWSESAALEWAKRRGARSGRVAWHFITDLAGQQKRSLSEQHRAP